MTSEDALQLANLIKDLEYKVTNQASQITLYEQMIQDFKFQIQTLTLQIELLKTTQNLSIFEKLLYIAGGGVLGFTLGGK